jgi:hypothetical protein
LATLLGAFGGLLWLLLALRRGFTSRRSFLRNHGVGVNQSCQG